MADLIFHEGDIVIARIPAIMDDPEQVVSGRVTRIGPVPNAYGEDSPEVTIDCGEAGTFGVVGSWIEAVVRHG